VLVSNEVCERSSILDTDYDIKFCHILWVGGVSGASE
jgi:hypothetical protein